MSWLDDVVYWLRTTGLEIFIVLVIWIVLHFVWKTVCKLLIKGLVTSTIKAREAVMRSKHKMTMQARQSTTALGGMASGIMHKLNDKSMDADNNVGGLNSSELEQITTEAQNDDNKDDDNQSVNEEFENIRLSDQIRHAMEERANTIGNVIKSIGNFVIMIVMIIMLLDSIGVSTAPILTAAALFGLALAFAAEDVVSDFVSGIFILAENQYFHGESVTINGYTGSVEDFTLRCTKLRAKNGDLRIIPNGEIREVTNKSRVFSLAVVTVAVPYSSEDDYDNTEECLSNEVVPKLKEDEALKKVLYSMNVTVKASQLLEESIKIKTSVKVRIGFTDTVQQKLMKLIRIEFPKKNISILSLESGMKAQNPDEDEDEDESDDEDDGPF